MTIDRLLMRHHMDHELCAEIRKLIAENKRLRAALEFYGDISHWSVPYTEIITPHSNASRIVSSDIEKIPAEDGSHICGWGGKRARQVLVTPGAQHPNQSEQNLSSESPADHRSQSPQD
jgi:hypothetical protein